jgi:hypothetical protein
VPASETIIKPINKHILNDMKTTLLLTARALLILGMLQLSNETITANPGDKDTLTAAANASDSVQVRMAAENYATALQSENQGVRESGIYHSLLLQLLYSDHDLEILRNGLGNLIQNEPHPRLRHKAWIAYFVASYGKDVIPMTSEKIPREQELFSAAAEAMNTLLLGAGE